MKRTNRNLLRVLVSIFDPLGMISPVTARIKTIFQFLCKDKRNWDDEIIAEVGLVWARFLQELTADIPTRMASNLGECFAGSWFSGLPLMFQTRLEVNDSADGVDPETQGSSQPGRVIQD